MERNVAVVIPTADRPELVGRAVRSVLTVTAPVAEVVVVVDGPAAATREALASIPDPRLTVVERDGPTGPSAARNAGVARATCDWVAFLDDDDVWLPGKLEAQVVRLDSSGWDPKLVVTTGVVARTPSAVARWPSRFIEAGEPVAGYLFRTRTPFQGETLLHTSTVLASRDLLTAVPFDESLRNHEDWDWLLRAEAAGATVAAVPEHLVVWHLEEPRPGLGGDVRDWDRTLAWAERRRDLLGPRAYSAFCLTVGLGRARAAGSPSGVARALAGGLRGRPGARTLAWAPFYALPSASLRRRVRRRLGARAPGAGPAGH